MKRTAQGGSDLRSNLWKLSFTGECCVALRSLIGASEQFETFLCHRGEEMGSIRGRVRIHVPKDRRATREKIYGGWAATVPSFSLLRSNYHFPLSFHLDCLCILSPVPVTSPASSLWFLNHPCLGISIAGVLSTASSFGSWLTDPNQMHPETLKEDRWVLCHQVRHYNITHR